MEIHRRMQVYGDDCVDVSIVRRWANRCKDGEPEKCDLCDRQRIERAVTETGEFHKEQVDEMIKENRRITQRQIGKVGRHKNNVLLQRDKARTLRVLPWKQLDLSILPHPPYSPDLAPCDFHLFPKMKEDLGGHQCTSNEVSVTDISRCHQLISLVFNFSFVQ
jgi:hypothetical protein